MGHNKRTSYNNVYLNEDASGNVSASGGTETTTITAPTGYFYEVIGIYYKASDPVGSAEGNHQLEIRTSSGYVTMALIKASAGNDVLIQRHEFFGDNTEAPSVNTMQQNVIKDLFIGSDEGMDFIYTNYTNATQTTVRRFRILARLVLA